MSTALKLDNIQKSLGDNEILKGISFHVEAGDIFGYLGPNGAGKTTTIRIILGLFKADSGSLKILDQDIEDPETRKKIGFVLDLDGLYDGMTAKENLVFYARIYGVDIKEAGIVIKSNDGKNALTDSNGNYTFKYTDDGDDSNDNPIEIITGSTTNTIYIYIEGEEKYKDTKKEYIPTPPNIVPHGQYQHNITLKPKPPTGI